MTIKRVWIEEGCISCSVCQDVAPDVFLVEDGEDCIVRPEAARLFGPQGDAIREAALDCPVEVIQFADDATDQDASQSA